jgi:hypothetical protein
MHLEYNILCHNRNVITTGSTWERLRMVLNLRKPEDTIHSGEL